MGRNGMTRFAVLAAAFSGAAFALGAGAAGANDPPDASLVAKPKVVQFGGRFNDVYRSVVNQCTAGYLACLTSSGRVVTERRS